MPTTMLFTSERVRPCWARFSRSSSGRSTTSVVSSWRTVITPGMSRSSVPFGPATLMRRSSIDTVTPLGTAIGARPMRDMTSPLPDVTEDLAADAGPPRFAVGQQPAAGGQDGDTETAEHTRHLVGLRVDAQTRLAHAAQAGDRALPLGRVLHVDGEDAARATDVVGHREPLDVALLLEDGGECFLLLRRRHAHLVVHRHVGVPDAGQHVRDRVGHHATLTSPARLRDAGDLTGVRQLAQADAAQLELAVDRARTTAAAAPRVRADLELRLALLLLDQSLLGHVVIGPPCGTGTRRRRATLGLRHRYVRW